ncbi:MAG TPA: tetratricopeptide repeat protein [bacterium]|nr:tetratricopeptide repeat protein [bacterium]
MLEIGILLLIAAIFIFLAIRFPKTKDFDFKKPPRGNNDQVVLEAQKILSERHQKKSVESSEEKIEPEVSDELDKYDKELSGLLKLARDKINDGKYSTAEGLLVDAVCKDNKCAWAYEQLGVIYLSIGKNLSDAKESFQMAIKLNPESAESWFGLGKILFSDGQLNSAIEHFQKATTIDRNNPEYQAELGKAYLEIRQFGKASKALKRASSLDISNQKYKELASLAEDKHREHSRASKIS